MCTVSFLPSEKGGFVLTSSRDVSYSRTEAEPPKSYEEDGLNLVYPRDGEAGGTWIGSSSHKRLICLLNGGFENHKAGLKYSKSRGLVVKDLLKAEDFGSLSSRIDLESIEPFTLVVINWKRGFTLHEFVWDGKKRHLRQLDWKPCIWSSATLYNANMKRQREKWFASWLEESDITIQGILDFHKNAGTGDPNIDVFLRRELVGTVSITQFIKNGDKQEMNYQAFSLEKEGDK